MQLPLNIIKAKASERDIDPWLLAAICWKESRGFVYAARYEPHYRWTYNTEKFARMQGISVETEKNLQKQSYGLAQVMGGTARWMGFTGPLPALYRPENNLYWAAKYLRHLADKQNKFNQKDLIAAYNAGSVRKDARGNYVNYEYVDAVSRLYKQIKFQVD